MKNTVETVEVVEAKVHPLQKSYMFISSKHIDYDSLTAFEAISMTMELFLAVTAGLATSANLIG